MPKAKSKREPVESSISYNDFSDEKRAQILSQEFLAFQESVSSRLGMKIGTRLYATDTKIEAVLVPVKTQVPQTEGQDNSKVKSDENTEIQAEA